MIGGGINFTINDGFKLLQPDLRDEILSLLLIHTKHNLLKKNINDTDFVVSNQDELSSDIKIDNNKINFIIDNLYKILTLIVIKLIQTGYINKSKDTVFITFANSLIAQKFDDLKDEGTRKGGEMSPEIINDLDKLSEIFNHIINNGKVDDALYTISNNDNDNFTKLFTFIENIIRNNLYISNQVAPEAKSQEELKLKEILDPSGTSSAAKANISELYDKIIITIREILKENDETNKYISYFVNIPKEYSKKPKSRKIEPGEGPFVNQYTGKNFPPKSLESVLQLKPKDVSQKKKIYISKHAENISTVGKVLGPKRPVTTFLRRKSYSGQFKIKISSDDYGYIIERGANASKIRDKFIDKMDKPVFSNRYDTEQEVPGTDSPQKDKNGLTIFQKL